MARSLVETIIGAVVVLVAVGFGYFAYSKSNITQGKGYIIHAKFDNVDGLALGSDVRIGGIKVGVISNQHLDTKTYQAVLDMQIRDGIPIPKDSTAAVVSEGLLGSKYVALEPGGDEAVLSNGGELTVTQSSVNLESLLGKFMFGGNEDDAAGGGAPHSSKDSAAETDGFNLGL